MALGFLLCLESILNFKITFILHYVCGFLFTFKYSIQELLKWQRPLVFLISTQNDISILDSQSCSVVKVQNTHSCVPLQQVLLSRFIGHAPFTFVHHCISSFPFRDSSNLILQKVFHAYCSLKKFSFSEAHMIACYLGRASPFLFNFNIFTEWIKSNLWKSRVV